MRLWAAGSHEDLPHGWVRPDSLVEIGRCADGTRCTQCPGPPYFAGRETLRTFASRVAYFTHESCRRLMLPDRRRTTVDHVPDMSF